MIATSRAVLSAGIVRPAWEAGGFHAEGPDEDAFTLGVAALETLGRQLQASGPRALRRLHLVGAFPPTADWAFGEALGLPHLEVRRHPAGASALWGALAAAAHDEGAPGREAVVAADVAFGDAPERPGPPRWSAGAVAFLLGADPGLSVLRHGFRGYPPGHAPTMRSVVAHWLDALGVAPAGGRGDVLLAVDDEPGRWLAAWEEAAPGIAVALAEADGAAGGAGPTLRGAFLLWELVGRLRTGGVGLVAEVARGRTGFSGFHLQGPVRWVGRWTEPGPARSPPDGFLSRPAALDALSQGAYVPHPRYLENLASRWRLVADRCGACGALTFPVRGACRSCGAADGLVPYPLPRDGLVVEAVTTIGRGAQPTEFDSQVEATGPYDVAIVRVAPGIRATLQLTDGPAGLVVPGSRVATVLRRLYPMEGEWRYGLKAVALGAGRPTTATTRSAPRPSVRAPTARRATPRGRGGRRRTRPRPAR